MLGDHDDQRVFIVRIWRERTAEGADEREWRGRLYDSQQKSFRHFVGLPMLFELIRTTLSRDRPKGPPSGPH